MLRVAGTEPVTEVEGPGRRFTLWLQGCPIGCEGCCNPQMQSAEGGSLLHELKLAEEIVASQTEGLTIVGGEPLEQIDALNKLLDCLERLNYSKGIILFTGYTWPTIEADKEKFSTVRRCDLLIAGPFIQALSPDKRKWIGSSNQTVHFFSQKFSALEKNWPAHKNEIEIHIRDGELSINGFPLGESSEFEKFFKTQKG